MLKQKLPVNNNNNNNNNKTYIAPISIFLFSSAHDRTCPHDLLQGVVAGTTPLVCADLQTENDLIQTSWARGKAILKIAAVELTYHKTWTGKVPLCPLINCFLCSSFSTLTRISSHF